VGKKKMKNKKLSLASKSKSKKRECNIVNEKQRSPGDHFWNISLNEMYEKEKKLDRFHDIQSEIIYSFKKTELKDS